MSIIIITIKITSHSILLITQVCHDKVLTYLLLFIDMTIVASLEGS